MEQKKIILIVAIIILTILTGVGSYYLYQWYKKKTPAPAKFGEMGEKPNCPLGYRYDEKQQKCVPIFPFFKI